jgi:hypothetical protein
MRNRGASVLRQRHRQLPSLLSHPRHAGMAGDANQAYPAGADLDHEQDVQRLEQHRLDGEEVGREDAGSLRTQERPPARRCPSRCRQHGYRSWPRSSRPAPARRAGTGCPCLFGPAGRSPRTAGCGGSAASIRRRARGSGAGRGRCRARRTGRWPTPARSASSREQWPFHPCQSSIRATPGATEGAYPPGRDGVAWVLPNRRGSELRWWGGRAVADRPVLGVRGGPSTGLPSCVAGTPSGAAPGRRQHQPGRLAGQRGVRADIAAAVIWPGREQMQVGPAAGASWDRSVAVLCGSGPVAPGAGRSTAASGCARSGQHEDVAGGSLR